MAFSLVQSGPIATAGTGTVTTTLSAGSTAGTLLLATVIAPSNGTSFAGPANWVQIASTAGTGRVSSGTLYYCGTNTDSRGQVIGTAYSATAAGTPSTFTVSGSAPPLNDQGNVTGITGVSGFSTNTTYYVVNPSGSTFQLSATLGGSATGSGSGSLTFTEGPSRMIYGEKFFNASNNGPNGTPTAWPSVPGGVTVSALNFSPDITKAQGGNTAFDNDFKTFIRSAPAGALIMPYHECNLSANGLTAAQVSGMDQHLQTLVNQVRNAGNLAAGVLYDRGFSTSAFRSGRGDATWISTSPAPDMFSMDGYATTTANVASPGNIFGGLLSMIRGKVPGAKVGIVETMTNLSATQVTNWMNNLYTYAVANNLTGLGFFFDPPGNNSPNTQAWDNSFTASLQTVANEIIGSTAPVDDVEIWMYNPSGDGVTGGNPGGITSATFTNASGVTCRGAMAEFSTAAGTRQVLDGIPGVATGVPSATSFPVTTPGSENSGDLAVSAFGNDFSSSTAGSWSVPAGWTQLKAQGSGSASTWWSGYETGISAGAVSVTGLFSTSTNQAGWAAAVAAFSELTTVSVTSGAPPAGTVGTAYGGFTFTATGGATPYAWSLAQGSGPLPAPIQLSSGGVLSTDTPTLAGTYPFTVQVTDANGVTATQSQSITINPQSVPSGTAPQFPANPLGILVEIQVNGTWVDITSYVYQRDGINITGGTAQEGSKPQPAQATLTLNNADGSFSPDNTLGQFYPYLQRNIQLRISVTAESSTGVFYSGYRFWGTVREWPPQSDVSGNDVYVQITANGPLRQINEGGGKGNALYRYYQELARQDAINNTFFAPIAYWPCEEDTAASVIGAAVDGTADMTITGSPRWKTDSSFNGSAPIPVINRSTWQGFTGSFNTTGDDVYTIPGTYQWLATTTSVDVRCWGGGGGGCHGSASSGKGGGNAGGGGEYAQNNAVPVTPGTQYQLTVGAGGAASIYTVGGFNGGNSQFEGDSSTFVTGHGGQGATASGASGTFAAGGTGSTAPTAHHDGGRGNYNHAGTWDGGAGGGGSGGASTAGGDGGAPASGTAGAAGTAGTGTPGGAKGGAGGNIANGFNGLPGRAPGGGGGGGDGVEGGKAYPGGSGAAGQVELVYTPTPTSPPPYNAIRFLLSVPVYNGNLGGNLGKVICQILTGGTLTKLEVCYASSAGNLVLKGYTGFPSYTLAFTSSNLSLGSPIAGQNRALYMISVELQNSSTNVSAQIKAIRPGDSALLGTVTTTQNTASIGTVSEVIIGPNSDITNTAVGHITVQYAFVALTEVSDAINGHVSELTIDRFARLCAEQALDNAVEFNEGADHWGFESGTNNWGGNNCTVATSTVTANSPAGVPIWPSAGVQSLLVTSTATGAFFTNSPTGLNGQPVNPGDIVSVAADIYVPVTVNDAYVGIKWFGSAGGAISETDSAAVAVTGGQVTTLKWKGTAPSNAAYFNIHVGDSDAAASSSTLMYVDNVRVSPRMGRQTQEAFEDYLNQIKDLEQGMLKEGKELNGMKYKTRIALINQTPALTLDYLNGEVAPPLQPVQDDKLTVNHVTVKRKNGSRVTVSESEGQMSTSDPPLGVGKHAKQIKVIAEDDAQLLALAAHLLGLGTDASARYPTVSVNLASANVAAKFALIPLVEIGDFIQVANLPFWYPDSTAKQLVIGYTETLNSFQWEIVWNCTPETPWEVQAASLRRW